MAGRRKNPVKFGKILEETHRPCYGVAADRRIVFFNAAAAAVTGWTADAVLGVECRHHGPTASDDARSLGGSLCPPAEAFAGMPTRSHTLILRPSGERVESTIEAIPLTRADGRLGLVLCFIDQPSTANRERSTLAEEFARLRGRLYERYGFDHLVARSPAMKRVLHQVQWAGRSRVPALLVGEPGVGKETLAQTMHYQGVAREQPLMVLDCLTLPPNLIHKQLADVGFFAGHADARQMAVYFREPQSLPRELQQAIVDCLGANPGQEAARLIAGVGVPLAECANQGLLVDGLLAHLSAVVIDVPALRHRREDLPLLVQQLIERANAAQERQIAGVEPDAMALLCEYSWPANMPELNRVVSEALALEPTPMLRATSLPERLRVSIEIGRVPPPRGEKPLPLDHLLETAERRLLELALRDAKGNKSKAAARLGISRARLHRRLVTLGLADADDATETIEIELADGES